MTLRNALCTSHLRILIHCGKPTQASNEEAARCDTCKYNKWASPPPLGLTPPPHACVHVHALSCSVVALLTILSSPFRERAGHVHVKQAGKEGRAQGGMCHSWEEIIVLICLSVCRSSSCILYPFHLHCIVGRSLTEEEGNRYSATGL